MLSYLPQLSVLTDFVPKAQNLFDYFLYNAFRGDRTETAVFILHSYIEAHEEAQLKILYYLGETEHADTPEEALVVRESQSNVSLARGKLSSLPGDIISVVHSKQAARVLLYTQEDMIEDLQSEGILQEKDAKILIRALLDDFAKLRGPSCQLFDQSWLFGDQTSENVSRSRGPKEFIFSPLFENHPEENSESAEVSSRE